MKYSGFGRWAWGFAPLAAGLVYSGTVKNGFAIDDGPLLLGNSAVQDLSLTNLYTILSTPSNGIEYLPVRDLTYALDSALFGLSAAGFHASNTLYFALTVAALQWFVVELLRAWRMPDRRLAIAAALLFAVHPMHVESVAGIAFRKDLLSGLLTFLSLSVFLRARQAKGYSLLTASVGLFALAGLSKATALVLPLLLVFLEWLLPVRDRSARHRFLRLVPFGAVASILVVVHLMVAIEARMLHPTYAGLGHGYHMRVLTFFSAAFEYLRLLVIPWPSVILRSFSLARSPSEPQVVAGLAAVGGLLFTAFWARRRAPIAAFASGWFLASILPVSGLVPSAVVVAERYLFLPSFSFCLIVAWGLATPRTPDARLRAVAACLFGGLMVAHVSLTLARLPDWRSATTLYAAGVQVAPDSPRLHWLLARELFAESRDAEAFGHLEVARRLDPAYGIDFEVFAALRALRAGQVEEAERRLTSLRFSAAPEVAEVNWVYGSIALQRGHVQAAQLWFERASRSPIRLGILGLSDMKPPAASSVSRSTRSPR